MALGKRRREQLGIQTPLDMQSSSRPSSSARQSVEAPAFGSGAPDRAAAGLLTGPLEGSGPDGRAVGAAEGMMAKWGYTPGQIWITVYIVNFSMHCFSRCVASPERPVSGEVSVLSYLQKVAGGLFFFGII